MALGAPTGLMQGTTLVANINTERPEWLTTARLQRARRSAGDFGLFRAIRRATGDELWRADGTSTALVADILPGS